MGKVIRWSFWVVAPVLLVFALVAWVDPYDYFGQRGPVPEMLKEKNLMHDGRTMPFSNALWKMIAFRRQPAPNVLLGDSRLSHFDLGRVEQHTGEKYFNFGIPGGNFNSLFASFWFADSVTSLKSVYLQVSFRTYTQAAAWDIWHEPSLAASSTLFYLTNRRVVEATGLNVASALFADRLSYDVLPPDQWEKVMRIERDMAKGYVYPTTFHKELMRIAERCRQRGIRLYLLDFPSSTEAQQALLEAGLADEWERYREEMRSVGRYIDLNVPSALTRDRSKFRDPLHAGPELQRWLIDTVWATTGAEANAYSR